MRLNFLRFCKLLKIASLERWANTTFNSKNTFKIKFENNTHVYNDIMTTTRVHRNTKPFRYLGNNTFTIIDR